MSRPPKPVYIYGLKDPRDGCVHYVGKANNISARVRQHMSDKKTNAARVAWIAGLKAEGLRPEAIELESCLKDDWHEAERRWIAKGRAQGWPLVNIADGGDGANGIARDVFEWFRPYLSPSLTPVFDGLSFAEKEDVCQSAALATFPYQDQAMAKQRAGEAVDWELWSSMKFWAACATATEMIRQIAAQS